MKLPVASGVRSIWALSSVYPLVASVAFSRGVAVTSTSGWIEALAAEAEPLGLTAAQVGGADAEG